MLAGLSHSQLVSMLWPVSAINPNTLTTGNTVNTYSASPQPAAGIDTWMAGGTLFRNLLLVIQVASINSGTLTVTLRDAEDAITTANGDASTYLVATLAAISAAGTYYAEFIFEHVFPATLTRVVADADNLTVRRYHSVRAVAAGGTAVFSILALYGMNSRDYPVQTATPLDITWVAA